MQEDYKPPPKKPTPVFSGAGNRLGGVVSGESLGTPSIPGAWTNGESTTTIPATVARPLEIDETLPITTLQIRLKDGTRYKF